MSRERTPSYQSELRPEFAAENDAAIPEMSEFPEDADTGFIPASHDTGAIGLHDESLFDQDERNSDGARVDEGTGLPYFNSGIADEVYFQETGEGHIVDPLQFDGSQDVMGPVIGEFATGTVDIADEWLRQHDVRDIQPTIDLPQIPEETQHVA